MEKNDIYRVKDLYLASFLYSQRKRLLRVEREGATCWFIFADKSSCEALEGLYWTNEGVTQVKSLVDSIRTLKDLIFAKK